MFLNEENFLNASPLEKERNCRKSYKTTLKKKVLSTVCPAKTGQDIKCLNRQAAPVSQVSNLNLNRVFTSLLSFYNLNKEYGL